MLTLLRWGFFDESAPLITETVTSSNTVNGEPILQFLPEPEDISLAVTDDMCLAPSSDKIVNLGPVTDMRFIDRVGIIIFKETPKKVTSSYQKLKTVPNKVSTKVINTYHKLKEAPNERIIIFKEELEIKELEKPPTKILTTIKKAPKTIISILVKPVFKLGQRVLGTGEFQPHWDDVYERFFNKPGIYALDNRYLSKSVNKTNIILAHEGCAYLSS